MKLTNKERYYWIDYLKVISILLVVVLHTVNIGIVNNKNVSGGFIYYFGTIAIPLFFMIDGYLLLSKERDYKYTFKRIKKISIIVLFYYFIIFIPFIIFKNNSSLFQVLFKTLEKEGFFYQFWFLGSLIIVNLLLPLFSKLINNNYKLYKVITIIMIIICILVDLLNIFLNKNYNLNIRIIMPQTFRLWTWFGYFLLGGLFIKENYFNKINIFNHFILCLVFYSLLIVIATKSSYWLYGTKYAESFYDSILCILVNCLLFSLFKKINFSGPKNIIEQLSKLTMGVYIYHIPIIILIKKVLTFNNNYQCMLLFILVSILSFVTSYIISKIPILKETIKI